MSRKIVTAAHSAQPENELSGINSLTFSPDGSTLYFNTAAWATSKAIHAVSVQGGRERFVTNGNGFAVVQHGKHAGYLVTSQHRYMEGHGSWNPYVLVSPEGKEIKVLGEFGDDKSRAVGWPRPFLDLRLFGNLERIVDLYAERTEVRAESPCMLGARTATFGDRTGPVIRLSPLADS
ncbi:hypothetical protein BTHE68_43980 [Burkholderia sp. THE68]|nr:hypothetical protein BTHE68_43980 [Burkholderia sp. THE68]